jgi:hypothetical protein
MSRTSHIRKSVFLLVSVAALVAPTAAIAYPVIGDDPTTAQSQAEGHDWYKRYVERQAARVKPSTVKPNTLCPQLRKAACRKP